MTGLTSYDGLVNVLEKRIELGKTTYIAASYLENASSRLNEAIISKMYHAFSPPGPTQVTSLLIYLQIKIQGVTLHVA